MSAKMKMYEHQKLPDSNKEDSVFSDKFLEVSVEEICSQLADNGFYFFDGAVSSNYVDKIIRESTATRIGFNYNDVTPVRNFRQMFFSNCLASSRSIVEFITNRIVHDIVRFNLGSKYRLKCQRYYESGDGYQLGWHTDNKTVDNHKTNVRGLVFIVYLCDTFDGELEVVKGSHNWSGKNLTNDFLDETLRKDHSDRIIKLSGNKGSVIITDTWTVHRTAMLKSKNFRRKSLFFQIDNDLMHSEKIVINPEFLPQVMTPEMLQFLGFGLPSGYKTMPTSGLNTLNAKDLSELILRSIFFLILRVPHFETCVRFLLGKSKAKTNVING